MTPKRNHWRLLPGGRLTFWRGSRKDGIPASFVWLGRRWWTAINLRPRTGWRPFDYQVSPFGPFEIERWPVR